MDPKNIATKLLAPTAHEVQLEQALKETRRTAIDAAELGNERDKLICVLTEIIYVVDRVNPAGRMCSISDMTKALLEIREAAFQAVAVPADHECRQPPCSDCDG